MLSNETRILILKERVKIHELQLQALCDTLLYNNHELYNMFATRSKQLLENDPALKEIRDELEALGEH